MHGSARRGDHAGTPATVVMRTVASIGMNFQWRHTAGCVEGECSIEYNISSAERQLQWALLTGLPDDTANCATRLDLSHYTAAHAYGQFCDTHK